MEKISDTRTPVLVIMDGEGRSRLQAALGDQDLDLVYADSAEAGYRFLHERLFAVILLDMEVRGVEGLEIGSRIRDSLPGPATPILLCFRRAPTDSELERGYRLEAVNFMPGPCEIRALRSKIHSYSLLYQEGRAMEARVREELKQSEDRFRILVEQIQDYAIIMLDPQGRIVSWNKGSERITGYRSEEVLGRHFSLMHLPEDCHKGLPDKELECARLSGRIEDFGWRLRKDGSRFWGEEIVTPILNSNGELWAFTKVMRDITDRKRLEESQLANMRYLEGMSSVSAVLEQNLEMEDVLQKVAERLLDLFQGVRCFLISPLDPALPSFHYSFLAAREDCPGHRKGDVLPMDSFYRTLFQTMLASSDPFVLEAHSEFSGWQEFRENFQVASLLAIAVRPVQSQPWGLVVQIAAQARTLILEDQRLFKDIAYRVSTVLDNLLLHRDLKASVVEKQRTEEKLRQSQKMEAIGRLAGGVAHDFNNLLTAINGYSEILLAMTDGDDPRRPHMDEIRKAGERAASLTNQLLVYSRRQIVAPRTLNLNEVVARMETMLRRLIGEDIELQVSTDPDIGPIHADPGQVEQVVLNLAVNARDAMQEGGILKLETGRITVNPGESGTGDSPAEGAYVVLTVRDTGIGMSADVQSHLFEPFFTTKRVGRGTGLGLSTVYGIVRQGNGFIRVESEPGNGTTFRVLFPAVKTRFEASQGIQDPEDPSLAGDETLLVVEDDPSVRRLACEILTTLGYRILEAGNGVEAMEVAGRYPERIDLLLTDVVMAQMGGRELVDRMKVIRPDMRTVYMSGYTDDAMVRHGILVNREHFLQKPFTPAALGLKIREVLDQVPA